MAIAGPKLKFICFLFLFLFCFVFSTEGDYLIVWAYMCTRIIMNYFEQNIINGSWPNSQVDNLKRDYTIKERNVKGPTSTGRIDKSTIW